jgi:putative sugar O-methyltransferase
MEKIKDDWTLFAEIKKDAVLSEHSVLGPGEYWTPILSGDIRSIESKGIVDFRSPSSRIGKAYSDSPRIVASESAPLLRSRLLGSILMRLPGLSLTYIDQISRTKKWFNDCVELKSKICEVSTVAQSLVRLRKVPDNSTLGGCTDASEIEGIGLASHLYLDQIQALDQLLLRNPRITESTTVCEIGGGFGVFTHIMLANLPKVKNVIYVDVFPNLYVAHQYLLAHSIANVKYIGLYDRFNGSLGAEFPSIFLMLPETFQRLRPEWEFLYNSNSAVEMSSETLNAYSLICNEMLSFRPNLCVALRTYEQRKEHPLRRSTSELWSAFNFDSVKRREEWKCSNLFGGKSEYLLVSS